MTKTKNKDTRMVPRGTTVLVGPDSTVVAGTAVVEPQFEILRKNEEGQFARFIRADTYKELHKALLQAEEREEQNVEVSFQFDCYPLDGIVAINHALELVYGFTHAKERQTFFGPRPPRRLSIATGIDESIEVAYGEMAPPSWEGGSLNMHVDMSAPLTLSISGVVKRKFEPSIKEIVEKAKEYLKTDSIYRGKAVELDLSYVGKDDFDPTNCAPRFIDVTERIELILPLDIEKKLNRDVWNRMRYPNNFRRNQQSVKRGVLLQGAFGTGKSLTSYCTAQLAMETGFTYFYLKSADQFLTGYKLAQLYGPSVFFVEDCDAIFKGERNQAMNAILEVLDGVGAKNCDVITVFTTNFAEKINEAFRRSGRIDTVITFTPPDAYAAARFVQKMAGKFLHKDADMDVIGEAFKNLVPADIKNGVDLAKSEAMGEHEDGADIIGKVTTEMLVLAGHDMQEKVKPIGDGLTQGERDLAVIEAAIKLLSPEDKLPEKIDDLASDIMKIKKSIGA